jgi:hypothetical protein
LTAPLFMGGEMGAFVPSSAKAIESTDVGTYNTSFARCSIDVEGSAEYAESASWTAPTTLYFHCDFYHVAAPLGTGPILSFYNGSTEVFRFSCTSVSGNIATYQMYYWNGGSFVAIGSSFQAQDDTLNTLDLSIKHGVSGEAFAFLSGTERSSGTADMSGFSGITKVRLRSPVTDVYFSQCVAHSESTVGGRLNTIVMTGQGTTHTFDTGGFANIDEIVHSDADLITSATAGQVELFTGTAVGSFTGYIIRALSITARVKDNGSSPDDFRFQLRSGGTTYDNGSDIALTIGYGAFCAVWDQNPATGPATWLSSELSALQYGLKSVA